MEEVLDTTGAIGAALLLLPLYASAIAGPAAFAFWIFPDPKRASSLEEFEAPWRLTAKRWLAGLLAFFMWTLFVFPSVEAVLSVSCANADDYRRCIEGE